MPYDFTTIYDRHGKDALAVEGLGKPGFAPPTARPSTRWNRPAGTSAWPGRTAVCSTAPALSV